MIVSTNDGGGKQGQQSVLCPEPTKRRKAFRHGGDGRRLDACRRCLGSFSTPTIHRSPTFRPRGARFSLHTTLLDCVGRGQGGSGQGFVRLDEQRARSARCCSGTLDLEPEPAWSASGSTYVRSRPRRHSVPTRYSLCDLGACLESKSTLWLGLRCWPNTPVVLPTEPCPPLRRQRYLT